MTDQLTLDLSATRLKNAKTIVQQGITDKVSSKAMACAISTACVESGLYNLASWNVDASLSYPHDLVEYCDRDSVGLFQQRALAHYWGTVADCMNPLTSAHMFYTGGIYGAPGLSKYFLDGVEDIGVLDQHVQVSAFPDRYAAYEDFAVSLVSRLNIPDAPHWNDDLPVYDLSQLENLQYHPDGKSHNSISHIQHILTAWVGKAIEAKVALPTRPVINMNGQWNFSTKRVVKAYNKHLNYGTDGYLGEMGLTHLGLGKFHVLS